MLSLGPKLAVCFSPKNLRLNVRKFWDWFWIVPDCLDGLVLISGLMSLGFVLSFGVPVVG